MKCRDCTNVDLKSVPRSVAESGFAHCKLQKLSGVYESIHFERECADYKEAEKPVKNDD